jgi:hypothetical protein
MMGNLVQDYSGIAVDQNAPSTAFYPWRTDGGELLYQYFTLPRNYGRGTVNPQYPDISGFQVLVAVDSGQAANASAVARIDYEDNNAWVNLATATVTGAPNDGPYVWFNVLFSSSIPVTADMAAAQWRFGISLGALQSISAVSYVAPAVALGPSGPAVVTLVDGTPLPITPSGPASLNFRILSLSADSGTDILGNSYRSLVTIANNGNIQTTAGDTPVSGAGQAPYWMSQILPSPTAVESLYFDVRPQQDTTTIGLVNLIEDPSFEYDQLGELPTVLNGGWWTYTGTVVVDDGWSASGTQSVNLNADSSILSALTPLAAMTDGAATPLSYAAVVNNSGSGSVELSVGFYDADSALIGSTVSVGSTSVAGIQIVGGTVIAPTNTTQVQFIVTTTDSTYVDAIQATTTATIPGYFDGDSANCMWLGTKGSSVSAQEIVLGVTDNSIVIDSVMLDPATPGMSFNVYYTTDDSYTQTDMSQQDWDSKLWVRVQQQFIATGRKQYVFPQPIQAKYMKIELVNPQGQSYNPGDFQLPVTYQQFPTWVSTYFSINSDTPASTTQADVVNVQYDALSLAYVPYLNDLIQAPAAPTATPSQIQTNTDAYWSGSGSDPTVDPTTLSQINIDMNPYQSPVGTNADTGEIVGAQANSVITTSNPTATSTYSSVTEGDPADLPTPDLTNVSSSNRDQVLAEQTLPQMYFYLTCRHSYKISTATFDYNRGYQFGVNSVAFMRNNYQVAADTDQYIETGGDNQNIYTNDFTVTSEGWFTYDTQ